jgi:peptidoglycan/LPS O-acetylase OafA/YrhL
LAILYVVGLHLFGYLKAKSPGIPADSSIWHSVLASVLLNGSFGVEMFFVLSGFLIFRKFLARTSSSDKDFIKAYYWRRLVRIEPPYLIALIINFCLLCLVSPEPISRALAANTPQLLSSLTYTHGLFFPHNADSLNISVWSLEVEVQFYLIAPLLLIFLVPLRPFNRQLAISVLYIVSCALCLLRPFYFPGLIDWLPNFLAGVFLAGSLSLELKQKSQNYALVAAGIALAVLLFLRLYLQQQTAHLVDGSLFRFLNKVIVPIAIIGLYAVLLRSAQLSKVLSWGILPFIGRMCFSVYLIHYPAIAFTGKLLKGAGVEAGSGAMLLVEAAIMLLSALLFCTAYYYVVERRFLRQRAERATFSSDTKNGVAGG